MFSSAEGFWFVLLMASVAAFLIFRTVLLWYWKVNQQVALLREISASLARLEKALAPAGRASPPSTPSGPPPARPTTPTPPEPTIRFAPKQ